MLLLIHYKMNEGVNNVVDSRALAELCHLFQDAIIASMPPGVSDPLLRCGFINCPGSPLQHSLESVIAPNGDLTLARAALVHCLSHVKGFRASCVSFVATRQGMSVKKGARRTLLEETELAMVVLEEWLQRVSRDSAKHPIPHNLTRPCQSRSISENGSTQQHENASSTYDAFRQLGRELIDVTQSVTREDEGYERGACSLAVATIFWHSKLSDSSVWPPLNSVVLDHRTADVFPLSSSSSAEWLEDSKDLFQF